MKRQIGLLCLAILLTGSPMVGQQNFDIPTADTVEVYKKIGDVELEAFIFFPPDHTMEEPTSAIIFFFGGGWRGGTPNQFTKQCEYLAARGMVAITAEYRVASRHGVKAVSCVQDAKSAVRWLRTHAERLGVRPNQILAAGGSAGGHLAASTALLPDHDDPNDDHTVSAVPNGLALFNPAVLLTDLEGRFEMPKEAPLRLEGRMGAPLISMSPVHHVRGGMGPCIIFHGTADRVVPYRTVEIFHEEMIERGNISHLIEYEGESHGFFNYLRKSNGAFVSTMQHLDDFLVRYGFIPPPVQGKER